MFSVCIVIVAFSFVVVRSFSRAIMFGGSVAPCEWSCLSVVENWLSAFVIECIYGWSVDDDDCDCVCVV